MLQFDIQCCFDFPCLPCVSLVGSRGQGSPGGWEDTLQAVVSSHVPTGGSIDAFMLAAVITKQKKTTDNFSNMSEYAAVQKSALKLKGVGDMSAGKK